MKKRILTIISVLFLLLGISFLVIPQISNMIGKQKAHSAIEQFEAIKQSTTQNTGSVNKIPSATEGSDDKNKSDSGNPENRDSDKGNEKNAPIVYHIDSARLYRDSVAYNEMLKDGQYSLLIDDSSYQQASLNLWDYGIPNNIYGYITAASIDMELPIYLGGTSENMDYGAAHLTYTSLPIGGESTNCVLAAHSGYIGRIFFDNISCLQIGDTVKITNLWDTLYYTVTEKHIYKKYESSSCYISEGKDLLTLITCANFGADRYYVQCERADKKSVMPAK